MVSTYVVDNCKCISIIDYKRPLGEGLEHLNNIVCSTNIQILYIAD